MAKSKPMSQANLVRSEGVPALGTYEPTGTSFNPVGYYKPDKIKYKTIWQNYDFTQVCSRFIWKDLPNGLTSWNIERMLYFRGSLAGFKFANHVYILPYVVEGGLNPYGMPTKIKPILYNSGGLGGEKKYFADNFKLNVDQWGDETDDYSAVILYDNIPYGQQGGAISRYYYNNIIINEIAETFARININVVVSNKKIFLQVKDPKQQRVIQRELETAFGSESPFVLITSPLETQTIQSTNDYNADDLFNTIKNYDSIRCFMNGISSKSFGSEKKERLVSGELAGAEEEKNLVLDMAYDMRKLFADLCNKKFGTNIKVFKRTDEYSEQVDGNNMTEEEKEGDL